MPAESLFRDLIATTVGSRQNVQNAHPGWGWLCVALGLFPLGVAFDLLPVDPGSVHAPPWVLALCGLVFVSGGGLILLHRHRVLQHLFAGTIVASFGLVGMWVALFAPAEGFSGGFFFVSDDTNVTIARWFFGIGALLALAIFVVAMLRIGRGDD